MDSEAQRRPGPAPGPAGVGDPEGNWFLQHRNAGRWELTERFARRGDALLARDERLAKEPAEQYRAVDLANSTIIDWLSETD